MRIHPRCASLVLCAAALASACVSGSAPIESISELGTGETALVGRIELVPPLKPGEQRIEMGLTPGEFKNRVFLVVGPKYEEISDTPTIAQTEGYIEATFGEPFYVRRAAEPMFINSVFFYIVFVSSSGDHEIAMLPARLHAAIRPTDRAVYIGTIRYHRDEFLSVSKVDIVDNFAKEEAAFRKKFGGKARLVKRLAVPVDRSGKPRAG